MRFLILGAVVVVVGGFGIYYFTLPKQATPPIAPAGGGIVPAIGQSLRGLGKQATMGPLLQKPPVLLKQPLVPATQAGQPVAANPWAALAATAPSLFTGISAIVTQEEKNQAANDAATNAQDLLLLQQAGGIPPKNGQPAIQPAMAQPSNRLSANTNISNPAPANGLDTAVVTLPGDDSANALDNAVVSLPDPYGNPDLSGTDLPQDTPIDTFDYQVPQFDPLA